MRDSLEEAGVSLPAALILTNHYSSVLTSFITVSTPVPIENLVEEIANNDGIDLVIVKEFGTAATILLVYRQKNISIISFIKYHDFIRCIDRIH